MEEEQYNIGKELAKKKVLSILTPNLELQGDIYNAKLFSCDRDGRNWLYSDVEGYLCFIVDYQLKTKYLVIFDITSFEKLFQYELYNNFLKFYEELAPEFRSFEIDSGFMGFQFESKEDAVNFDSIIQRLSGLTNDLFAKPRTKEDMKLKEKIADNYCKRLKEKFSSEDKYDENYAEDGTTILTHNNFKVLQNIEYDKETKQFKFGKISEELKEMFLSFGIKKKDLERDADFAFSLLKKVIVGLGSENTLKNSALDSIEHNFPPPEERERIMKQEQAAEAKMNYAKNKRRREPQKKKQNDIRDTKGHNTSKAAKKPDSKPNSRPNPKQNSNAPNISVNTNKGIPPPPPPPPPPPNVPKAVPNVAPKVDTSSAPSKNEESNRMDELISKRGNLKKVEKKEENSGANDIVIQGQNKNFLQNALSQAIKNRRNNLHMHDDDEEDEDNDWD
jgi:hypothetical protein